jgi:hypothetical protein
MGFLRKRFGCFANILIYPTGRHVSATGKFWLMVPHVSAKITQNAKVCREKLASGK